MMGYLARPRHGPTIRVVESVASRAFHRAAGITGFNNFQAIWTAMLHLCGKPEAGPLSTQSQTAGACRLLPTQSRSAQPGSSEINWSDARHRSGFTRPGSNGYPTHSSGADKTDQSHPIRIGRAATDEIQSLRAAAQPSEKDHAQAETEERDQPAQRNTAPGQHEP
jgi:hypothetical protein